MKKINPIIKNKHNSLNQQKWHRKMARQGLKQNITKYLKNQQHTQKDKQFKIWV
jgi:hypothetical protein